jgi:hypothetical protein
LGKAHVCGDLLDVTLFKNFAKKFVGLHGAGLADWRAGAIAICRFWEEMKPKSPGKT